MQSKRLPYKMKIQTWDMELPRSDFSARKLKTLYDKRWKIELAFRDIKHALGALHFHSKKDLFNVQEFFAHLLVVSLRDKFQEYCRRSLDYEKILKQITHYVHPIKDSQLFQRNCRYIPPLCFNYRVA